MLDFADISKYSENNRIEAKKAAGGLPHSLWETYSSFANTIGGIIILGVEEVSKGVLAVSGIDNPDAMINEFWKIVNDKHSVSTNILTAANVRTINTEGKNIIAIEVPRASRHDRPVYLNQNPWQETYRRSGEGDYRCSKDEVDAMLRDKAEISLDASPLGELKDIEVKTLRAYRLEFDKNNPLHAWSALSDELFLEKVGAVLPAAGSGEQGMQSLCAAGLWMFGKKEALHRLSPGFSLTRVLLNPLKTDVRDDFSNLYDFYENLLDELSAVSPDFEIFTGLSEGLTNALVHADYQSKGAIFAYISNRSVSYINPGSLRISPEFALGGGLSDTRNSLLLSMFSHIGLSKGEGGGLYNIRRIWGAHSLPSPMLSERFNPERTVLRLPLSKSKESSFELPGSENKKHMIIDCLTTEASLSLAELSGYIASGTRTTKKLVFELMSQGILEITRQGDIIHYRLRTKAPF